MVSLFLPMAYSFLAFSTNNPAIEVLYESLAVTRLSTFLYKDMSLIVIFVIFLSIVASKMVIVSRVSLFDAVKLYKEVIFP